MMQHKFIVGDELDYYCPTANPPGRAIKIMAIDTMLHDYGIEFNGVVYWAPFTDIDKWSRLAPPSGPPAPIVCGGLSSVVQTQPKVAIECKSPEVITNMAMGKEFLYCRGCKQEVQAGHGAPLFDDISDLLKTLTDGGFKTMPILGYPAGHGPLPSLPIPPHLNSHAAARSPSVALCTNCNSVYSQRLFHALSTSGYCSICGKDWA